MKNVFDSGSRFNRFLTLLMDIIVLNILWMLCCLPVITYGASTIALYTMTLRRVRDEEGSLIAGFFKAFRGNIGQSIPVTVLFFALYGCALTLMVTGQRSGSALMFGGSIVLLWFITAVRVWIFPLIARYDNRLPVHFNNAWRLAVAYVPYTLTFIVTTSAPWLWAYFSPDSFVFTLPFWILMGGAGAASVNSIYLRKVFDTLEKNSC